MGRALAVTCLYVAGALWVGCGGAPERRAVGAPDRSPAAAPTKVFEIADYALYRRGYSGTGSSLRRIDPATLRPLTRRGLRLGGYSYFHVLSPDRRTAVFGLEFGELVFVDLARQRVTGRVYVGDAHVSVRPVGWPRPDLVVAHTCSDAGKYGCLDSRVVLVDPQRLRRRAELAVRDFVDVAYHSPSGRSVFVTTGREHGLGPARLVVVEPSGLIRETALERIRVGAAERALGTHYRTAAFALDGGRAIVFGSGDLVAEVRLTTLDVRYHRVPALDVSAAALRAAPNRRWYGTLNPYDSEHRVVERLHRGAFVVGGRATMLVRGGVREASTRARVLDTRSWRTRLARRFETGTRAGRFRLVATGTVEAKRFRGPFSLSAFGADGRRVWRLRFPRYFTWTSFAPFLYVGGIDGRMNRVYDLRTGRLVRRIKPTDVEPAFRWTPPQ